jgi:hypothetical protein
MSTSSMVSGTMVGDVVRKDVLLARTGKILHLEASVVNPRKANVVANS